MSLARMLVMDEGLLAKGGKRMRDALEYIHGRGFVHM